MWGQLQRGWDVLLRDYEFYIRKPLEIDLLTRVIETSILIGIVAGVVGSLVVVRGLSFLGDALAHSVLPGVVFMYQRSQRNDLPDLPGQTEQAPLFWGGMFAGIFSALLIGFLTRNPRLKNDSAIGIVFVGMFALGVAMTSRLENAAVNLSEILFGQVLGISQTDFELSVVFSLVVLGVVLLFYKEFLVVSFDPTLAKTLRLPTEFFRFMLLILIAVTIVIALQIVGVALMMALLVIPAATASLIVHRLHWMMLLAALIGAASSIIGFYLSYHLGIPAGPAIVLSATCIFGSIFVKQSLTQYVQSQWRRFRTFYSGGKGIPRIS